MWKNGREGLFFLDCRKLPLAVGNMDIVFIKSAKIFHAMENFTGNRKTMAFYAHSLIDTPNTIDCEAKQFLSQ
jgi:hypothetical protein